MIKNALTDYAAVWKMCLNLLFKQAVDPDR